jgi:hypothetical protein
VEWGGDREQCRRIWARRTKATKCRSGRKQCVCGGRIGLRKKKKSIAAVEPEVVTISNVQDLCGLSPINLMRRSNALFGRAADQYAAILFFHDSRCWPRCGRRLLVATGTRAMAPYFGLNDEPMAAASKITMQRAGRVVLALRWTAGKGGHCSAGCGASDRGDHAHVGFAQPTKGET